MTNKKVCRDILKKLRETFGEAECGGKRGAYDGDKSFFTSGSLSFNSKEFPVFLDDRKGPTFRPGRPGEIPPRQSPPPGKCTKNDRQMWCLACLWMLISLV